MRTTRTLDEFKAKFRAIDMKFKQMKMGEKDLKSVAIKV
jgi:hypothetical protein